MAVVEVVFQHIKSHEKTAILYKIFDFPVAQRWLTYLETALREGSPIEEYRLLDRRVGGRFVGFPGTDRNAEQIAALINECIGAINDYAPGTIDIRASADMNQDRLNHLHKYFEIYRGPVLAPHEIYEKGPDNIKKALEDFNIYIHEFEDLHRVNRLQNTGKSARLDVVFLGKRTRYELYPQDYEHFVYGHRFGDLTAHYCEVGKQLLDVYRDVDEIVGEENIRPLKYISADFDMFFGADLNPEMSFHQENNFRQWLFEMGYKPWDPKTSQGYLKLGEMIRDERFRNLSQEEFIAKFDGFWDVKAVHVHR